MPFIPLKEDEKSWGVSPCRDKEHNPPNMIVWGKDGWWVCPSCGHKTRVSTPKAHLCDGSYTHRGPAQRESGY